jgi:hypothetical protein
MKLEGGIRCPSRSRNCYTASIRATWAWACRTSSIFVGKVNCLHTPIGIFNIQYYLGLQETNLERTVLQQMFHITMCTPELLDRGRSQCEDWTLTLAFKSRDLAYHWWTFEIILSQTDSVPRGNRPIKINAKPRHIVRMVIHFSQHLGLLCFWTSSII